MQAQIIKAYVDKTFEKYDTDKSGTLDEQELTYFFNDLFKLLGTNVTVTREQSLEAINSIDQNSDGSVDKEELFEAFMKLINTPPPQLMTQSYPQPSYPPPNGPYYKGGMTISYPQPPQYPPPPGYPWYNYSPCDEYGVSNR